MRLFVAVEPPKALRGKLGILSKRLGAFGGREVEADKIHISICFIGNASEDQLRKIKAVLETVVFKSFECGIRGLGCFTVKDPRVVFAMVTAGEEKLRKIQAQLSKKLKSSGIRLELRDYTPHLTLGRTTPRTDVNGLLNFLNENRNIDIGSFTCDEIKIKESVPTGNGYIYKDIDVKRADSG